MLGQRIAQMGRDWYNVHIQITKPWWKFVHKRGGVGRQRAVYVESWVTSPLASDDSHPGHQRLFRPHVQLCFFSTSSFAIALPILCPMFSLVTTASSLCTYCFCTGKLYEEHKFWWPLTIAYLLTCTANCNFLLLDLQSFAFTWKILHFLSTEVLDLAAFAMMLRPN